MTRLWLNIIALVLQFGVFISTLIHYEFRQFYQENGALKSVEILIVWCWVVLVQNIKLDAKSASKMVFVLLTS